jgi:hypothetical protein
MAVVFKLDAIASIGSAVALLIFTLITAAHFRVRSETGANSAVLTVAIVAAAAVLVTFVFTELGTAGHSPARHRSRLRVETNPRQPGRARRGRP